MMTLESLAKGNRAMAEQKTIDLLSKIIKKPPLNSKLLSKPPFRYLHDMFSEIIKTTGAFDGLYSQDEMNSENFKVFSFLLKP
jgi:TRAF3-interacting protein 1